MENVQFLSHLLITSLHKVFILLSMFEIFWTELCLLPNLNYIKLVRFHTHKIQLYKISLSFSNVPCSKTLPELTWMSMFLNCWRGLSDICLLLSLCVLQYILWHFQEGLVKWVNNNIFGKMLFFKKRTRKSLFYFLFLNKLLGVKTILLQVSNIISKYK